MAVAVYVLTVLFVSLGTVSWLLKVAKVWRTSLGVFLLFVVVAIGDIAMLTYKKLIAWQRKVAGWLALVLTDPKNTVYPLYVVGHPGAPLYSVRPRVAHKLGP